MSPPPAVPPITPNNNRGTGVGTPLQIGDYSISEQSTGRDLLDILKPGDKLSGRVVDQFANGAYLFTIRGRNIIASSQLPLLRDSVVQFEVINTKDGLHIRLNGSMNNDSASTSNMQSRLHALKIPINPSSMLVMQHFEQAGAPLDKNRLTQAIQSLQQAPPTQQASLAASHALLARQQLPVTPAFLNLAQHALAQSPQNHQTALTSIQQSLGQMLGQTDTVNTTSNAPPSIRGDATVGTSPPAQHSVNPQGTAVNNSLYNNTTGVSNIDAQKTAQHLLHEMPLLQLNNSNDVKQMLAHNGIQAIENVASAPTPQGNVLSELNKTNTTVDGELNTHIGKKSNNNTIQLRSVVQELAILSQHLHQQQQSQQHSQNFNPATIESLNTIIQDLSADSIFKPQHLSDYDYVLPLFSQHNGSAQQARIAIATRNLPGQQEAATFLRVDMELSHLGPLSLRMSSGNGPIVITIFATAPILTTLAQAIPQLEEDLEGQHVEAHIRIADLLEHQESSHA